MQVAANNTYNVSGVRLERPFKIRRLGHFGLNFYRLTEAVDFYRNLLGFRITDVRDFTKGGKVSVPPEYADFGNLNGYFMRYGSDHHALVLYNHRLRLAQGKSTNTQVTINQITWQVGSLAEVVRGYEWLKERGCDIRKTGRDMPGSNWHVYLNDFDGHQNELYYGMEQVGWTGHSKPRAMHVRAFDETPTLPQIPEFQEVDQATQAGVDLLSGYRDTEELPLTHDVDGILLARPFKVVKLGPLSLFVDDVDRAEQFYRSTLGFVHTEDVIYQGFRIAFLRNNTEHHSLTLYPTELREVLGMRSDTSLMSLGLQVAGYRQLRDARAFLASRGVELRELPPELSPGMDHTFFALDPDGHAIQLYWSMEQIGWDGRPRPANERRRIVSGSDWPAELDANEDSFAGEPWLGPWS